jgi:hypothetical protein
VKALKCICNVAAPLAPNLLAPLNKAAEIGWDRLICQRAEPNSVGDSNEEVDGV